MSATGERQFEENVLTNLMPKLFEVIILDYV